MAKDVPSEKVEPSKKNIITVPVTGESELDGKRICEIKWAEDILVVAIIRNEHEIIPKGNTKIEAGDRITILLPEKKVHIMKESLYKLGTCS